MTDINSFIAAAAAAAGGQMKTQIFTANGTWTRPDGVDHVYVFVVGGGGGGGGARGESTSNNIAAGGGGGGGQVIPWVPVAVSGNVAVTVGAGGAGGTGAGSTPVNGSDGGDSSFAGATTITALGGCGGGSACEPEGGGTAASAGNRTANKWGAGGAGVMSSSGAWASGGAGAFGSSGPVQREGTFVVFDGGYDFSGSTAAHQGPPAGNASLGYQIGGKGYMDIYGCGGHGAAGSSTGFSQGVFHSAYGMDMALGFSLSSNTAIDGAAGPANTGCGGCGALALKTSAGDSDGNLGGDGADGVVIVMWSE